MTMMIQQLAATNNRNGNPRRCWALYGSDGTVLEVRDEGYAGKPAEWRRHVELPRVNVTPGEYRSWIAYGRGLEPIPTCSECLEPGDPAGMVHDLTHDRWAHRGCIDQSAAQG